MEYSFHYLIMAQQALFQKELLARLKDTDPDQRPAKDTGLSG